jgi:hypothetical protein
VYIVCPNIFFSKNIYQQKRGHDVSGGLIQESSEEGNSERNDFHFFKEMGRFFLFVMYLISHLRFHCVGGCWDRTP